MPNNRVSSKISEVVMDSCFNGPMRITQTFGNKLMVNGKDYYAQWNLKGHNGIDVVPMEDDWNIYNYLSGKILKIEYNNTYGNRILIWNKKEKLIEYHNHMEYVNKQLVVGQHIDAKTLIGKMGNTGKSFGAHDHIAMVETDSKGYRINRDNGYNGWIDPCLYI